MLEFDDRDEAEFASAEEKADNFDPIPDGNYVAEVISAVTQEKGGHRMLTWHMKVVEGDFSGRHVWRNSLLDSRSHLEWLKTDMKRVGKPLSKLADLNATADQLAGMLLDIAIKQSGKYSNVYINRLHKGEIVTSAPPMDDHSTDEEIPF